MCRKKSLISRAGYHDAIWVNTAIISVFFNIASKLVEQFFEQKIGVIENLLQLLYVVVYSYDQLNYKFILVKNNEVILVSESKKKVQTNV